MTTTNKSNKPMDPPAKTPDYEDDDDASDEDDDTVVGTCLHCNCPPPPRSERGGCGGTSFSSSPCPATDPAAAALSGGGGACGTRVQVSCDDCRSFICDGCHWCHEFQANHEIRVCDRCDAFYCRACDEMDQCEDCSEVVCNTCSTLMSCKFCGCGLCEDCATACGRCGIVLCARDAKFAVECDTCKMSYCLVCLASGTKDPCVRCGHRPSKRVEQLVHLRLKSIYKAFKQSGASSSGGPPGSGGEGCNNGDDKSNSSGGSNSGRDTSSTYRGKYSSALRSLTENETLRNMEGSGSTNFDQSMANEVAAVLQTASNSMSADGGDDNRRSRGRRVANAHPPPPFSANDPSQHAKVSAMSHRPRASSSPLWQKTREEIEAAHAAAEASANAAAAALLAELDEEETNGPANNKKSKKKKKKKDKKKESNDPVLEKATADMPTGKSAEPPSNLDGKSGAASSKKQGTKSESVSKNNAPLEDESSDEEEMVLEQLVGMNKSTKPPKKERQKEEKEKPPPVVELPPPPPPPVETPDLEKELSVLISNNDEDGLEEFLSNLKGVPGLSVLRKATKKALKKLKDEKSTPEPKPQKQPKASSSENPKPASKKAHAAANQNKTAAAAAPQPVTNLNAATTAGNQHGPLLRVVSRTQSAVGGTTKGGAAISTSVPASARAECVMHMSPTVVGWVIGKGGQRIRDMMEESGAKIWIDQESMGVNDARVVYVSGKRSAVDTAVRMVKDLIAKAPVSASAATATTTAQGTAPAAVVTTLTTTTSAPPKSPSPVLVAAAAPPQSMPEPSSSFAAAASHTSKQAAPAVAPVPASSKPSKKAPAAGWTKDESSTPPPSLPKSAAPVSKPAPPANDIDDSSKNIASLMNAARQQTPEIVRSEINCDPQFIGLLLGRDGLAAKSIQTESGASLHFNQTVAPGTIGISGKAENVAKAEQLIHGVLRYREEQLQQEAKKASVGGALGVSSAPINNLRPDVALNQAADLYSNDLQRRSENISTMPSMQLHNLQRAQEDLQFQNQRPPQISASSGMGDPNMNFPPGYDPYQRASSFGSKDDNSLQRQGMLQRHSPLPQPPRPTSSSSMADPNNIHRQQQEWGQLHQSHLPNQYPSMSQFSSGQQMSRSNNYMGSNVYASSNNPVPQNSMHSIPPAFPSLADQNLSYLQNLDAPRQAPAAPLPQGRLDRIEDFLNRGNPRHDMNGWGLNVNGVASGGDSWNQSQIAPQTTHPGLHPGFATQRSLPMDSTPSLSDNLFLNQQPQNNHSAPASKTAAKPKIDDSQFVDNMFNSLGESGKDGDGLLDSLNSMSLGGLQQGGTWGANTFSGWGGLLPNDDSSSLLNNNRRGSGFDSNFGNQR